MRHGLAQVCRGMQLKNTFLVVVIFSIKRICVHERATFSTTCIFHLQSLPDMVPTDFIVDIGNLFRPHSSQVNSQSCIGRCFSSASGDTSMNTASSAAEKKVTVDLQALCLAAEELDASRASPTRSNSFVIFSGSRGSGAEGTSLLRGFGSSSKAATRPKSSAKTSPSKIGGLLGSTALRESQATTFNGTVR